MRPTLLGSILGIILAPCGMSLSNVLYNTKDTRATSVQDEALRDNLHSLRSTLTSFETRQAGSEQALVKQLEALTNIVATTQQTNQAQLDALAESVRQVRSVAATPPDTDEFKDLLRNFSTNLTKRIDDRVKTMVSAEIEDATSSSSGVGTLDVNSNPNAASSDIESIQTISDAATRIIALEKEVALLKSRSFSSTASQTSSSPTYYPSTVSYGVYSGGSCGNSTNVPQYSYSSYSQPTYRYSQPTYSYQTTSAPQVVEYSYSNVRTQPRRRFFQSTYQGKKCYTVNGETYCE